MLTVHDDVNPNTQCLSEQMALLSLMCSLLVNMGRGRGQAVSGELARCFRYPRASSSARVSQHFKKGAVHLSLVELDGWMTDTRTRPVERL